VARSPTKPLQIRAVGPLIDQLTIRKPLALGSSWGAISIGAETEGVDGADALKLRIRDHGCITGIAA
jgi:hypothetical protein